jgi:uncharacterized protein YgiB involved in biofilm formation
LVGALSRTGTCLETLAFADSSSLNEVIRRMRLRLLVLSAAGLAAAFLFAPAAHATYDGQTYPSHADCSADARADEAATRDTTADVATCASVPGTAGQEWEITITQRQGGLTSGSSGS